MKKLSAFLIVILVFSSCAQKTEKTEKSENKEIVSTYYLIRHAEKDRSDSTNENPGLNKEGLKRAENWAKHFEDVKFDMVFSTDYYRTIQTAKPTAKANNIDIQIYDPSELEIDNFLEKTKGKTVLIVGHVNTTPKLVNRILDEEKYEEILDHINSNLYIVTITKDSKKSELLVVN